LDLQPWRRGCECPHQRRVGAEEERGFNWLACDTGGGPSWVWRILLAAWVSGLAWALGLSHVGHFLGRSCLYYSRHHPQNCRLGASVRPWSIFASRPFRLEATQRPRAQSRVQREPEGKGREGKLGKGREREAQRGHLDLGSTPHPRTELAARRCCALVAAVNQPEPMRFWCCVLGQQTPSLISGDPCPMEPHLLHLRLRCTQRQSLSLLCKAANCRDPRYTKLTTEKSIQKRLTNLATT